MNCKAVSSRVEGCLLDCRIRCSHSILDPLFGAAIAQGLLELATPYYLITGCTLQLNGAMGLALLAILLEIVLSQFLVISTPSGNLDFLVAAHLLQDKIHSSVP